MMAGVIDLVSLKEIRQRARVTEQCSARRRDLLEPRLVFVDIKGDAGEKESPAGC